MLKPIKPKVLVSRIKALLKRYTTSPVITYAGEGEKNQKQFIISREKYTVIKDGEEIFLPRKEFELLELLASKPDRLFTREVIFNQVWGSETIVGDRTMDVHIRKLRSKIGDEYIKTIKGVV